MTVSFDIQLTIPLVFELFTEFLSIDGTNISGDFEFLCSTANVSTAEGGTAINSRDIIIADCATTDNEELPPKVTCSCCDCK